MAHAIDGGHRIPQRPILPPSERTAIQKIMAVALATLASLVSFLLLSFPLACITSTLFFMMALRKQNRWVSTPAPQRLIAPLVAPSAAAPPVIVMPVSDNPPPLLLFARPRPLLRQSRPPSPTPYRPPLRDRPGYDVPPGRPWAPPLVHHQLPQGAVRGHVHVGAGHAPGMLLFPPRPPVQPVAGAAAHGVVGGGHMM